MFVVKLRDAYGERSRLFGNTTQTAHFTNLEQHTPLSSEPSKSIATFDCHEVNADLEILHSLHGVKRTFGQVPTTLSYTTFTIRSCKRIWYRDVIQCPIFVTLVQSGSRSYPVRRSSVGCLKNGLGELRLEGAVLHDRVFPLTAVGRLFPV